MRRLLGNETRGVERARQGFVVETTTVSLAQECPQHRRRGGGVGAAFVRLIVSGQTRLPRQDVVIIGCEQFSIGDDDPQRPVGAEHAAALAQDRDGLVVSEMFEDVTHEDRIHRARGVGQSLTGVGLFVTVTVHLCELDQVVMDIQVVPAVEHGHVTTDVQTGEPVAVENLLGELAGF